MKLPITKTPWADPLGQSVSTPRQLAMGLDKEREYNSRFQGVTRQWPGERN